MGMTTNKKDLFILIFKLIIFTVGIMFLFFWIMPEYEHNFTASLIDKMNRLESIKEPKIVLIGNSNLAYGMNSQKIEERFGMPVVNMGFNQPVNNAFHEEMAKVNVTPGDIYIICHTGYSDTDEIDDPVVAWGAIEDHLDLWQLLRVKDIYPMLKAYPIYLKGAIRNWSNGSGNVKFYDTPYSREAFNVYGDVEYHRENKLSKDEVREVVPEINQICTDRINSLNRYLEERGAKLVIAGYPITVDGEPSAQFREQISQFGQELERQCECEVISDFEDYFFDYKYCYDMGYHLTSEGADLRTEQLIRDLEGYLK